MLALLGYFVGMLPSEFAKVQPVYALAKACTSA